jgi:hypothetical protein
LKRKKFKNNTNIVREPTTMMAKEEVAEAVEALEEVAVATEVAIDLKPKVDVAEEETIEIETNIKKKNKMKVTLTPKQFTISKVEE